MQDSHYRRLKKSLAGLKSSPQLLKMFSHTRGSESEREDVVAFLSNREESVSQLERFLSSFGTWINFFKWEIKLDLTLPNRSFSPHALFEKFNIWRSGLCQLERLRVGYLFAGLEYPHLHCHILMLGRSARTGRTLLDVDLEQHKQRWINQNSYTPAKMKEAQDRANKIEPLNSGFDCGQYIVTNLILYGGDEWFWKVSEPRFLKKFHVNAVIDAHVDKNMIAVKPFCSRSLI